MYRTILYILLVLFQLIAGEPVSNNSRFSQACWKPRSAGSLLTLPMAASLPLEVCPPVFLFFPWHLLAFKHRLYICAVFQPHLHETCYCCSCKNSCPTSCPNLINSCNFPLNSIRLFFFFFLLYSLPKIWILMCSNSFRQNHLMGFQGHDQGDFKLKLLTA